MVAVAILVGFGIAVVLVLAVIIAAWKRSKQGEKFETAAKDVAVHVPTKIITIITWIFIIGVLIVLIAYGGTWAYVSLTEGGSVAQASASLGNVYNTVSDFVKKQFLDISTAVNWESQDQSQGIQKGVILEEFDTITGNNVFILGQDIILEYNVKLQNTTQNEINVGLECQIKDKFFRPVYRPNQNIIVRKERSTNALCSFNQDQVRELGKGDYIVLGNVQFKFQTRVNKFPVYFTTIDNYDRVTAEGQDFFRAIGLQIGPTFYSPYYGEPVELAINVDKNAVQPVLIGTAERPTLPYIGLTLRNKWQGQFELEGLKFQVPELVTVKTGESSCPFERKNNEYYLTQKALDDLADISSAPLSFQCFLDINPEIVGQGGYTQSGYSAEAEYIYKTEPVQVGIKIGDISI